MFDYKQFGIGVKYFREKLGQSQELLAEIVDVGSQHIYKIETGNVHPSLELMVNICNVLGVSVNDCVRKDYEKGQVLYKQVKTELTSLTESQKKLILEAIESIENV